MTNPPATPPGTDTGVPVSRDQAVLRLARAHSLNQPATDEARSAEQRATVIAAVASLAASLSPAGATLLLEEGKLSRPGWLRVAFGVVLCLSVLCFLAAAIVSLLVHRADSPLRDTGLEKCSATTSALDHMADRLEEAVWQNWRAARAKHRSALSALGCLVAGLALILVLTVLALVGAPF